MSALWTATSTDGVTVLTFSNPPSNMITFGAMGELEEHLTRIAADPETRVVVLSSGVDGYFAAHADLDDLEVLAQGPVPEARSWYSAMSLLESMPQPVVAAVDGRAGGGGFELTLACTLRWASDRSTFRFLETALGIIPGAGGTQRLTRLVGVAPTAELVLSGEEVSADDALRIGCVGRVLPHEGFGRAVLAAATRIARTPGPALAAAKRVIYQGAGLPIRDGLRLEGRAFADLLPTPEATRRRAQWQQTYRTDAVVGWPS